MIILQETATSQTFKFIPRYYVADSMDIMDEQTGDTVTYAISPVQTDYYLEVTATLSLIEGHTYTIKVYDGTEEIYYDRIFVTNQTVSEFSVNDGIYTTHSSNNEFIFLS